MEGSNRRWLISVAIVLLVHAGIAAGVLTWRHMASAPPVLIDLTPAPSASQQNARLPAPPVAEQAAAHQTTPEQKTESASTSASASPSASASGADHGEAVPPSERAVPANETVAKSVQGTGPAHVSPGANPPQLPPAPQGAEAGDSAAGGAVVAGGAPRAPAPIGPMPGSPMANMPLDTSITVQPPLHGANAAAGPFERGAVGPLANRGAGPEAQPFDRRPTSVFRPAKPFGVPDVPRNSLLPNGNSVVPNSNPNLLGMGPRNPQGAQVQERVQAAMAAGAIGRGEPVKNAIGSTVTSNAIPGSAQRAGSASGAAPTGIGASTIVVSHGDADSLNSEYGLMRNAVGLTANFRPRIPSPGAGETTPGIVAVVGREMPTARIIDGHGLMRPIAGPAVIGGPARRAGAGMLSGSDFHLRHP